MRPRTMKIILIVLGMMLILPSSLIQGHASTNTTSSPTLTPQPIKEGPIRTIEASSNFYWFQYGALGDANSQNVDGASMQIRTVHDTVRNDAHSYWIGTGFSGGQFVQVGYLNGLSTTGQPYCCAWFFESFNTPSCDCPPVIGPEGSAGPVGSWHTYSMQSVGNGVWSFYMDGKLLGSSPQPGQSNYLGSGATSTGTCSANQNCAPAGIAEVAQAGDNLDVIGPAEFKNITIHKNATWQSMPAAVTYCCYGYSSNTALPISYGLWEINGINNDYLTGTGIRPSAKGSSLWPVTVAGNSISFNFIDKNGNSFTPDWVSLEDPGNGNLLYLTNYNSQTIPLSTAGVYIVNNEYWHGVNVSKNPSVSDSAASQTIQGNVFSVPVRVVGRFYSLPVGGATVLTYLPDSTNETLKTDSEGNVTLYQIPPGNYSLRVSPPFGVPSVYKTSVSGPVNLSVPVFSLAELLTIIVPPIAVAIAVVALALRREQARRAALPVQETAVAPIPVANCRVCGKSLGPYEYFCTTCGTPRSNLPPSLPASAQTSTPQPQSETPPPSQSQTPQKPASSSPPPPAKGTEESPPGSTSP